jgi:SAM-dependent MidA family methyltransferase
MSAPEPGTPRESPLETALKARISRDGPIGVADYIEACLHDPVHGYYRHQAAIGAAGDFVTAPEISQVFGELMGLWCAVVWQQMGSPSAVRLIELGPGRGTLMADALRAARIVPAFRQALQVELVESNATLVSVQRTGLAGEGVPITWSSELRPGAGPTIVIANEFLDTLPMAQWVWRDGVWRTRRVGLNAAGALAFVDDEPHVCAKLAAHVGTPREGDIYESREKAFDGLADKLAGVGSPLAALMIDYGHTSPGFGDTLQAVSSHRHAPPLATPGEADLTAQVDFAAFAKAVRRAGLATDGPLPQGEFLGRLGAIERTSRLMAANPGQAGTIEAGIARLMAPAGMGGRFQVIGIRSVDLAPLPALADVDTGRAAP